MKKKRDFWKMSVEEAREAIKNVSKDANSIYYIPAKVYPFGKTIIKESKRMN